MMRVRVVALGLLAPSLLAAQAKNPLKYAAKPTVGAITAADLMSRVYPFADDSMMGRQAGTVYHDKGVEYIARELRRLGLRPAGENGTYFQTLPIRQPTGVVEGRVTVDGREFLPSRDFLPRNALDFGAVARDMQATPVVYGGVFGDPNSMIAPDQAANKAVIFTVPRGWQANRGGLVQRYITATAVIVASLDSMPPEVQRDLSRPSPAGMKGELQVPAFFYASRAMADAMMGGSLAGAAIGAAGKAISGSIRFVDDAAPGARNVIAVLPGSDPQLANQYVAIGSHSDHVGFGDAVDHDSLYAFYHVVRRQGADDGDKPATAEDWPKVRAKLDSLRRVNTARADSIFNGADDDASGSMAMLEVAEAFATAREKPRRSILFVWHNAEEGGLIGAAHFTDNPTVPRDSIVAQINLDMVGRGGAQDLPGGGPGYLQLIGARRLSTQLGDIVEAEGRKFSPAFRFDYQYDANGHPQQFYCRSDHYMYARYGIPVVFMSTGGHPEYHQVTDEPQYIDYDQLARVSQLVYNVAGVIANRAERLVVDKPKPDPRGQCVQ